MTGFEEYLVLQGYTRHKFERREGQLAWWPDADRHFVSSAMPGHSCYCYKKPGAPVFYYGLHERGLPSVLISPRPLVNGQSSGEQMPDYLMHRLLQRYSPEVIYSASVQQTALEVDTSLALAPAVTSPAPAAPATV